MCDACADDVENLGPINDLESAKQIGIDNSSPVGCRDIKSQLCIAFPQRNNIDVLAKKFSGAGE